ncbi:cell division protein ZapA [Anaerotalea alkaliphila]|uniref:Cell division protein ZapA n=1 Tax=Anaerotalea alkaliphila TaxID=2662126 RepID=A0A7X5HXQ5_9FIRM|nr:cell division protein ZapA [Anaerotalea alkaliphila]NDL68441.1 cell division protein ZapA [Anaerotalea alkaliphila]
MSQKNDTKVTIGDETYTLSGKESPEYLQRVALYINNKMGEVKASASARNMGGKLQSVLLAINIADDLFKAKETVHDLEKELERCRRELEEYIEIFDQKNQ